VYLELSVIFVRKYHKFNNIKNNTYMTYEALLKLIETENEILLTHTCSTVSKELLHIP